MLIVDDQELVREGLIRILGSIDDVIIVGQCRDGSEVLEAIARHRPDVVVMDVRMREVDGTEATRRIRASREDAPPVLMLTTFGEDEVVAAALSAGAAGFILKDAPGEDLIRAVKVVAEGGVWLDPTVLPGVLATYRTAAAPRAAEAALAAELTDREREVLRLIGRGLANRRIAETLSITEATVKSHVGNILQKLQLPDRPAAIVYAFDHGLVAPGEQRGE
ncbi:MAG: response regulator transcription factor [Actinobacteria bacterium]|nr:response regulator transcription factor [Actinomycetota bacterium]